ncbi:MAG: cbb3-type cytochrome c oxidase subunit I [Thermoleophilia bacterium]
MTDYERGDGAVKLWFFCSIIWFPLFASLGLIMAIKFFDPDFLTSENFLTFGRIRPAHVNGVLFGFLSSGLIATMLHTLPRLCRTPLKSPGLAKAAAVLWNGAILIGIILIFMGYSQGREYAELPWIIDVAVLFTLLLLSYIVFGTLIKREEKKLYVTTWYYAGTFMWFPVVYFIGNVMWKPTDGALNGTTDAIFNWYYGHNVLGLWFTTLGIAAWYFFIPRGVRRPLYSHLLSLIAFFTIAFFYTGVGGHHLLQAPIPEWVKTIAVLMSILMLIPVLTFATNIMLTVRGTVRSMVQHMPMRFVITGFVFYILTSFQGSFQALRDTNSYLHFSQWTVGHAHLALLGSFGFLVIGLAYWLVPSLYGVQVYSRKMMSLSFWLIFVGFLTFFSAMVFAGLVANSAWWDHLGVATALPMLKVYFIARAIGGGIIIVGAFVFAINLLLTMALATEPFTEFAAKQLESMPSKLAPSRFMKSSQEKLSLPIIVVGGAVVFTIMTFMVVAMPYMYSPDKPSGDAHQLSALEQEGLEIYKSEGCFYCHSQFVRPQDWAMGNLSTAGDFYYSVPNLLGTERTGPNLSQIGGKRPTQWHYLHDRAPRTVSPGSVMPNFGFLSDHEIDALVAYIQNLGGDNLDPQAFQPSVPDEYRDKTNPYEPLVTYVQASYDALSGVYSGDPARGAEFASVVDTGKDLYTEKCVSCHGGSGNGQGPYARMAVTRPANLNERLSNYPDPAAPFHFWRVATGVPGTAMPAWGISLSDDEIWKLNTYEMTFRYGSFRTIDGTISDQEGDNFAQRTGSKPAIAGTPEDFQRGKEIYALYCAQCHGESGQGDGPASIASPKGYIQPKPANFTESARDFELYGRYVWKVTEGVETTNMPPWKRALSEEEISRVIFYIQRFAAPGDYNSKWGPLYSDPFARNLKAQP